MQGQRSLIAGAVALGLSLAAAGSGAGLAAAGSGAGLDPSGSAVASTVANGGQPAAPLPFARRGVAPAAPVPGSGAAVPADLVLSNSSLVNDPTADTTPFDTQSEPAVVRVGGSERVVASFNDSGSFTNPNQVQFTGYSTSDDGGTTWTDRGPLPASEAGDVGDPSLAYSARTGTVLLATLRCVDAPCSDIAPAVDVFRSTDNGTTFTAPVVAGFGSGATIDKEWITVDNTDGVSGSGFGNAYVFARDFGPDGGMKLIRSTDDGLTWNPPITLSSDIDTQGAFVLVGPDHTVDAFWLQGPQLLLRRSTDQGLTFGTASVVADLVVDSSNGGFDIGGPRTNSFLHAAADPTTGALFATWNDLDQPAGDPEVYLASSTDGGATWSDRTRVNSLNVGAQWMPTVAVSPAGGAIMVSWYDRRTDPGSTNSQRFARMGTISGGDVTWDPDFALSPLSPDVIGQDPAINPTYMGDYDMIAAGAGAFVAMWADNRGPSAAHTFQPDVRAARVPQSPAPSDVAVVVTAPANVATGTSVDVTFDVTATAGTPVLPVLSVTGGSSWVTTAVTTDLGACNQIGRSATCEFPGMTAGVTARVNARMVALQPGTESVTGTATHAGADPTIEDNVASASIVAEGVLPVDAFSQTSPCDIPDPGTVECPLTVDSPGIVANATVGVRIAHTYTSDLNVELVAPDGRTRRLASRVGENSNQGYGTGPTPCDDSTVFTTFRDDAQGPIGAYPAPFAGAVRPDQSRAAVAGSDRAGIWKLRIADESPIDSGTVLCWQMTMGGVPAEQPPPPLFTAGPQVLVGAARIVEGDQGAREARIPITLSQPSTTPVEVDYMVHACLLPPESPNFCAARQGRDFRVTSGTLAFNPGPEGLTPTTLDVVASVKPDTEPEFSILGASEVFSVSITRLSDGWTSFSPSAWNEIADDDPGTGDLTASVGSVAIWEGDHGTQNRVIIPVTLSRAAPGPVLVRVRVVPVDPDQGGATPGEDYVQPSRDRVLRFQAGDRRLGFAVRINPDRNVETDEYVGVEIASVSSGVTIGGPGSVTILDDDLIFLKPTSGAPRPPLARTLLLPLR